jgi:primosomal protein N' (replication factor Y)
VEVVVPLPLDTTFTYHIPEHLRGVLSVGSRVIVPFGLKKFYTAIVVGTPNLPPAGLEVKDVAMVLDPYPVLRHPQLKLWRWIADYYLCAIGDVYKTMISRNSR